MYMEFIIPALAPRRVYHESSPLDSRLAIVCAIKYSNTRPTTKPTTTISSASFNGITECL